MITCLIACLTALSPGAMVNNQALANTTASVLAQRGTQGTFVLYDQTNHRMLRADSRRSRRLYAPASTFKVLNALIALETGVLKDENQVMPWDGVERQIKSWNQDQTLTTGIQYSALWAFQWIAREVGRERMQHYLNLTGYGNGQIGEAIDQFWLDGSLLISPEQQVNFLRDLYHDRLPFKQRHMATVRRLIVQQQTEDYRISGKTGWGVNTLPETGWFVGYLEKPGGTWFFALNVDIQQDRRGRDRQAITTDILEGLGLVKIPTANPSKR